MDITTFSLAFNTMSSRRPVSVPYTSNTTVTFPAGVFQVDMTGYGARGSNGSSGTIRQYRRTLTVYAVRRSDGVTEIAFTSTETIQGTMPQLGSYCDPPVATQSSATYSSNQACYSNFTDTSYSYNNPATTGASATGLSRTFPGSTGNVAQTPVGFTNVPVTAETPYNLVIPSGGSITINYYA